MARRTLVALACAGVLASSAAIADPAAPVTFNVSVKVSNLMASVVAVGVTCAIYDGAGATGAAGGKGPKLAEGFAQADLVDGAYEGVITVPVPGDYSMESLRTSKNPDWICALTLVNIDGTSALAGSGPASAMPTRGTPFTGAFEGNLPMTNFHKWDIDARKKS